MTLPNVNIGRYIAIILSVVGGINVASAAIASTGAITVTGAATVDGATYVLNPVALNGTLVWTSSGTCLTTYNYC